MNGPIEFLDAVAGYSRSGSRASSDRPIRLATIDPAYDPFTSYPDPVPSARVRFEGESTLSGKAYPVASGYVPQAGDRVWMVPVGTTYLISGRANQGTPQGFWQNAETAGVEFGFGSYWDTDVGLHLEGDAHAGGDLSAGMLLTHGPRSNRVPEFQFNSVSLNGPGTGLAIVSGDINFSPAWPADVTPIVVCNIMGSPSGTGTAMARPQAITNTKFNVVILKSDIARANFVAGENFTVHWIACARPSDVS